MADSAEHKFISESIDRALKAYSQTRLLGLLEAERRKFDYGCLILRDASRPLVSQVLWSHEEGLEKDIRTLIFEAESSIKLYMVRDRSKIRARVDEILKSYRENNSTRRLLRGLRIIPIADGFDADRIDEQRWMDEHILNCISTDLLFSIVFGKIQQSDVRIFALHGGPLGLKLAVLHVIDTHGYEHGPTFEKKVGSKGSPLREAIAMLTGVGFIVSPGFTVQRVPTLKGRFFLDFARLLTYERKRLSFWSDETLLILNHLQMDPQDGWQEDFGSSSRSGGEISNILMAADYAKQQFNVDIMEGVTSDSPNFYSNFSISKFTNSSFPDISRALWEDPDDIATF